MFSAKYSFLDSNFIAAQYVGTQMAFPKLHSAPEIPERCLI
jgi:hypothetical protein